LNFELLCQKYHSFGMLGSKTIRHIWRVANGLDNAILNETQNVVELEKKGENVKFQISKTVKLKNRL